MSNTKYNTLVTEPTLVVSKSAMPAQQTFWHVQSALTSGKDDPESVRIREDVVAQSMELYARSMLGSCAPTLIFPAYDPSLWASPTRWRRLLCPTIGERIKFVDNRDTIWSAVQNYFAPMCKEANSHGRFLDSRSVVLIGWVFYKLVLATRWNAEMFLDPDIVLERIDMLLCHTWLSRESKARLSVLRGIFSLYSKREDIPGFSCSVSGTVSFSERLDEILEDAYLLEASALRRFLGVGANIAATKRDMRKIIAFICKNRPWAKGILRSASQLVLLPQTNSEAFDHISGIVAGLKRDCSAPLLRQRETRQYRSQTSWICFGSRNVNPAFGGAWESAGWNPELAP